MCLIKITLNRNTSRGNKLDLAESREFIRIGILEGVQGYGCLLIYKDIHLNFTTHIVLSLVDSGGPASVQA